MFTSGAISFLAMRKAPLSTRHLLWENALLLEIRERITLYFVSYCVFS